MFERYTESARRVLFFARYEASQFGSVTIETDHLLLGLTREAKGVICEIFAASHVSLKSIRHEIESRSQFAEKAASVEIPFSEESKRALQYTAEESDRLGHNYIGTEHLLLGLLREATSPAAVTLTSHGLHLEDVRRDLVKLLGEPSAVLGLPTHAAEADEHVERIKRLVVQLETPGDGGIDPKQLVERILRELDSLKRRLFG